MHTRQSFAAVSSLTFFALLIQGYHPYGEDGGVYLAGVKKLLHPELYPRWTPFVTEHLRFSLFGPLLAALVRISHLQLETVVFLLYLLSTWTTLLGAWALLARATPSFSARLGGTALLACWLTIPIAGTSLMLADPYLTARSFTTPLTLFALAWAWDWQRGQRPAVLCLLPLLVAAALHPLMAGYAAVAVLALLCAAHTAPKLRHRALIALLAAGLLIALCVQLRSPAESPDQVWVAMTRYYWFPFRWEWYEQLGLFAPLALLWWLSRSRARPAASDPILTRTALTLAALALVVAALFSRAHLATHLVACMQPLRLYGTVYLLMILLLGAWIGKHLLRRSIWRWATLLLVLGSVMFTVQRTTYPASTHLELPGRTPTNPYVQAFLWIRRNTPVDALFALDAHYITHDGEDAQSFRPTAERSALPDYSKDGGEASITPDLIPLWVVGQAAQTRLDDATDTQRLQRLRPLGATWTVLRTSSVTTWNCPYRNNTVKVCRLP